MKCYVTKQSGLFLLTLLCAYRLGSQVTSTAQTYTVQVSAAQAWTDSGLDLQSGDVLELSAAPSITHLLLALRHVMPKECFQRPRRLQPCRSLMRPLAP
jgi:hypothetical protein